MSKPPLILSSGFLLTNVQPLRIQNFRASASTGALHFCLGNTRRWRVCWSADSADSVRWVRNKPLCSAGKPNQSRPCNTCPVTVIFQRPRWSWGRGASQRFYQQGFAAFKYAESPMTLAGNNHVFGLFWSVSLRKTLAWVLAWMVSFVK